MLAVAPLSPLADEAATLVRIAGETFYEAPYAAAAAYVADIWRSPLELEVVVDGRRLGRGELEAMRLRGRREGGDRLISVDVRGIEVAARIRRDALRVLWGVPADARSDAIVEKNRKWIEQIVREKVALGEVQDGLVTVTSSDVEG